MEKRTHVSGIKFLKIAGLVAVGTLLPGSTSNTSQKGTIEPIDRKTETSTLVLPRTPTPTGTSIFTPSQTESAAAVEDERKIPLPKIMVLGDSITKFGFADYLSEALNEKGYQVEFVGSNTGKNNIKDEGHGGFTTTAIERDLEDGYWSWGGTETPTDIGENIPDILILELGTNDASSGFNPEYVTIPNFRKIIAFFRSKNPDVKIIIFPDIPFPFEWDKTVVEINKLFLGLTRELNTAESPVVLAPDIRSDNFNAAKDLIDGTHPTASGYQKMVKSCMAVLEKMISLKK
jgi:lysophospholipase L1-like esterase